MKIYLISIATGVLVGIIYGLLNVRSPAPPAIALIGLLGMLIGEQVVPIAKRLIQGHPVSTAWVSQECVPKITGRPSNRCTSSAGSLDRSG
jgi:XapX domain-containing protein